jgi:hypothetical protein
VHLFKEFAQPQLKRFVLAALVEFADEVPAGPERVEAERQCREAEVLESAMLA